jgi:hypothetical protein
VEIAIIRNSSEPVRDFRRRRTQQRGLITSAILHDSPNCYNNNGLETSDKKPSVKSSCGLPIEMSGSKDGLNLYESSFTSQRGNRLQGDLTQTREGEGEAFRAVVLQRRLKDHVIACELSLR